MEPSPFENVDVKDAATGMRILSVQDKIGYDGKGTTTILDTKGKKLWSMPVFFGNKKPQLSPDGRYLALIGNIYFESMMNVSSDELLVEIFDKGKIIKSIVFSDLIAEDPKKLVEKLKLLEIGGGWISRESLVRDIQIDWKAKTVVFKLYTNDSKKISF